MEIIKAGQLFENVMKVKVFSIERCNTGIGNYVFIVTAENNKYILRSSLEKDAYENTVYLNFDEEEQLKSLFAKAVPDYDEDRFYVSHMKKVVEWYNDLKAHASLEFVEEEEEAEAAEEPSADPAND